MNNHQNKIASQLTCNSVDSSASTNSSKASVTRQFSVLLTAIRLAQSAEKEAYGFRIGEREESSLTDIANAAWDSVGGIAKAMSQLQASDLLEAHYLEVGEIIDCILDAQLNEREELSRSTEVKRKAWQKHSEIFCPNLIAALDFAMEQRWLPVSAEGEIDIQFRM